MFKCTKDPENKKWHKSNAEAIVCGCLAPKSEIAKTKANIKKAMPAGLRKYLDDKTAGKPSFVTAGTAIPAVPAESQKPEQEQQPQTEQKPKNWILEICIAIIAVLLTAFWIFHYFLMPPKREEEKENE